MRISIVIVLGALVLALAIGWQFARGNAVAPAMARLPAKSLVGLLPDNDPAWRVEKLQLGATEFETEYALRALQCDDYVYNRYVKGDKWFSVYVAYWSPGKMPVYYVARKTPDACWPRAGMECVAAQFGVPLQVAELTMQPAQVREFKGRFAIDTRDVHVLFWLLVDGKAFNYGTAVDATFSVVRWWRDMLHDITTASKPRIYFVRISANHPVAGLITQEPLLQRIMHQLGKIGLTEPVAM